MSQMEEGTAPDFTGAGLGAMTGAVARGNIASSAAGMMYADPVVVTALVRAVPKPSVPAITDVEADPASSDQGVAHRSS
jgi:hypothetical protein